jgi:hypothetical protein
MVLQCISGVSSNPTQRSNSNTFGFNLYIYKQNYFGGYYYASTADMIFLLLSGISIFHVCFCFFNVPDPVLRNASDPIFP